MMTADELAKICDELLYAKEFDDYCPNGLQVEAQAPISRIITGVTACQALIEQAVAKNADAILVHHGYFWKGEPAPLTGMKGKRIRTLLQHNISLLAYHLPLDTHPTLGNNALLAKALELTPTGALHPKEKHSVGIITECVPIFGDELAKKIETALERTPLHIKGTNKPLQKIGICTGGAQDMIINAYQMGCDAFISGEISERTTHQARELGLDYFAAGHHTTETFGVKALGEYLAKTHGFEVQFIDIKNPA